MLSWVKEIEQISIDKEWHKKMRSFQLDISFEWGRSEITKLSAMLEA